MKNNYAVDFILNSFAVALTSIQTEKVFQTISLILTIISIIISIIFRLVNWFSNAKKDGKIDNKEIKDLTNIVNDGVNDLKDEIDKADEIVAVVKEEQDHKD